MKAGPEKAKFKAEPIKTKMSLKGTKTTTSGMEWNTMLGLLVRLKNDGKLREYLLIATGSFFGLRVGDLLNIKWNDVLDKDEFSITEGKTGKHRKITINKFAKEAIKYGADSLIQKGIFDSEGYIFCNKYGRKLTRQFINLLLQEVSRDYNIKMQNPSTHTLRKTFGKRVWESDGKSERALVYLSEIFSHSSLAVTKRYIGITDKIIADVYMKL
ncbi:MAG: tyrosine-type recombinase/integrase [Bacteroidia bacterium]